VKHSFTHNPNLLDNKPCYVSLIYKFRMDDVQMLVVEPTALWKDKDDFSDQGT
jgi:hypothetical protein